MMIALAASPEELEKCYPVMHELRTHLAADEFLAKVQRMQKDGYQLAYLEADSRVVCVAGFRIKETLFCDRFLYVDDLATLALERSKGYGHLMLEWLKERAREERCLALHLDSGMQRIDAHRFYDREGLQRSGYHFAVGIAIERG